jgi:transcription initiation factor TFIID TATA-box-binding protein
VYATKIDIQNVVASFMLEHLPNLEKIRRIFAKECFFDTLTDQKFTFRVVALRIQKPKMSLLIYRTGKVVCTGAKTIEDAKQSANFLINRLKKAGFNLPVKPEVEIQNIVATINLKTPIDIETFVNNVRNEKQCHVIYEPEQFPAAIVKFPVAQGTEATILLFSNGKMVCVGLTHHEHMRKAVEVLISKIKETVS